ncbi:unnamed protein product [Parnassius apollo]|uniref:(apollo) hypothetical protein n=1 Tax=Parnassius apollo TaxID=110799 RepID=A0A8S3W0X1_PARAO|nr:unnamed protein product [Parnassius apollo]
MECEDNGFERTKAATAGATSGIKRKRRYAPESYLQLGVSTAVPCSSDGKQIQSGMVPSPKNNSQHIKPSDNPFMSNMEEIAYWVQTKRAPCLYNYDKINNKPNEQAHCSKFKPKNITVKEVPSPKKRKKRKLVLLDDDSGSIEIQQNIYFNTTKGQNQRTVMSNGKPSSIGSDIDFNIKNSSIQGKPKRMKLQPNNDMSLVKKNKMLTSTPNVKTLRRSLRKCKQNLNNISQLDMSFEMMNKSVINGIFSLEATTPKNPNKPLDNEKKHDSKNDKVTDQSSIKPNTNSNKKPQKEMLLNGQFEDMSDVSGLTANYIRSTKIQAIKAPRNMKNNKTFIQESQQSPQKGDTKTIMCVNKSMNTGLPDSTNLICSTDSSQNVINLVTIKSNKKSTRVSRATSLLKFLETKQSNSKESICDNDIKHTDHNLDISILTNSTSRYPKRHRNYTAESSAIASPIKNNHAKCTTVRRKKISKEYDNSDRKENPEEELISRTRSGRKIGLKVRQPENSVLVLSNSTEQVSSEAVVNVARPQNRKKRQSGRCTQLKKSLDKSRQSKRDSLRDKSGFAACFSESDDDSELLKQRKFFC